MIDSGVANLASVLAALSRLGRAARATADADLVRDADRIIIPGVGAAAAAMERLHGKGLVDVLRAAKQPVLGICLGMQLLFARSEEGDGVDCLGVMAGNITPLKAALALPVPHMGWNRIRTDGTHHSLLRGIADGSFMYFAHSFAAPPGNHALAFAEYGRRFAAVVARENFFGCQFHPERSGRAGREFIANFLGL
ncbi:MAG: imidazole glycerol phosphate synthase subunit HisH [Rhizomicrobium sp.]